MQRQTLKNVLVIIIVITGAIFGILFFYNSQDSSISPHPEPIMTPVYLGSLSSAKLYAGADLRVPGYLPSGYNFSQGSLFTGRSEKTQLTFQNGPDVIHVFQWSSINPPPYFIEVRAPEPVSIAGNAGTWIPGTSPGPETKKPFNQIQWSDGTYSYWIQSSLDKDEMIKIAGSLAPISDELIEHIPGPLQRVTRNG